MKGTFKMENCEIIKVQKQSMGEGNNVIVWDSCMFVQGMDANTMTIDKDLAPKVKRGSVGTLVVSATEKSQYQTKFKITGFIENK